MELFRSDAVEEFWKNFLDFLDSYGGVFAVLMIILGAILARWILVMIIRRVSKDLVKQVKNRHRVDDTQALSNSPLDALRIVQRTRTMSNVLSKLVSVSVYSLAVILLLDRFGFPVTALITSAGILGAALAFGAQSLVKDIVSGIFMVFEDQLGIGDLVDLGEAVGIVESVGIRATQVRDINGTVWYVRNGEVLRVGNMSQGWSRIVIDLAASYSSDIERVKDIMLNTAKDMAQDPEWKQLILETPEIWGIETLNAREVVIRLVVKTKPGARFSGARELRLRLKQALDENGVLLALSNAMVIAHDTNKPETLLNEEKTSEPVKKESETPADSNKSKEKNS